MAARFWDRMATTYETDNAYVAGQDLMEEMRSAAARALPDGDVVELGCGTGWFTRAYAPRCRSVVAVDASPAMLKEAERTLGVHPHVSLRLADARETGLPAASADAVLIANVLDIVREPGAIVAEAARLLRPGGVLLIANFATEGMTVRQRAIGAYRLLRRWRLMSGGRQGRFLTLAALLALVRAAGFPTPEGHVLRGRSVNAVQVRAVKPSTVGP
nr:methyltransferase domain-containing protein [Propionibacterium sp.]